MKICAACSQELPKERFSKKQWQLKSQRRCKECIAENRAFVRCVRNFLNIHIVGADEIDSSKDKAPIETSSESIDITPQGILAKNLKDKMGVSSFDGFKDWLRALYKDGKYDGDTEQVKSWNAFKDIPAKECRKLLKLM